MKLTEIVVNEAIIPELGSTDRDGVLTELVEAKLEAGAADPAHGQDLIAKLLERERKGSTGFGRGVAVPHVKHPSVKKMAAAVGLSAGGLDFDALDKQPVYSVFLLISPDDRPEEHLQAMEAIFANLSKESFRRLLRQATTRERVIELLEEADSQHLAG